MSYALAKARYASATTQTVTPAQLLIMLYDRLVQDLATAEDGMQRGEFALVGDRLGRAQEILLELRGSLDTRLWPEGEPLGALYLWMVGELNHARLGNDPARVAACRELVEPLRDAWRSAAAHLAETMPGAGVLEPAAASMATLGGVA